MKKNFIIVVLFLYFAFLSKCHHDQELKEENIEGSNDDDLEGYVNFKKSLKEYLVQNKLFDSERLIQPDEMKRIFLDSITEGEQEYAPDFMRGIFSQLAEYFVNSYYKEKKEIKGKEIYDLFDIKAIYNKFHEMVGKYAHYSGDDGEENYIDSRNNVGDPNPDV